MEPKYSNQQALDEAYARLYEEELAKKKAEELPVEGYVLDTTNKQYDADMALIDAQIKAKQEELDRVLANKMKQPKISDAALADYVLTGNTSMMDREYNAGVNWNTAIMNNAHAKALNEASARHAKALNEASARQADEARKDEFQLNLENANVKVQLAIEALNAANKSNVPLDIAKAKAELEQANNSAAYWSKKLGKDYTPVEVEPNESEPNESEPNITTEVYIANLKSIKSFATPEEKKKVLEEIKNHKAYGENVALANEYNRLKDITDEATKEAKKEEAKKKAKARYNEAADKGARALRAYAESEQGIKDYKTLGKKPYNKGGK